MSLAISDHVRLPAPHGGTIRIVQDASSIALVLFPKDGAKPVKFIPAPPEKPRPRKR